MKKIILSLVLVLCLLGGWGAAVLSVRGEEDTATQVARYRTLAEKHMQLGGYGRAIECYEAMVRLEDTVETRLEQAWAYERAELTAKHEDALGDLIRIHPEDPRGYEALATYYDSVGAHSDCVEVVRKASAAGALTDTLWELYYANAFVYVYLAGAYDSATPMKNGAGVVTLGKEWGLLNSAGDLMGGDIYDYVANSTGSFFAARDEERSGYITTDGQWYLVLEKPFDSAYSMSQDIGVVFRENGVFLIDRNGADRLGPFEDATGFSNGVAAVKEGGVWRLIDTTGSAIGESAYEDVRRDSDGLCATAGVIFVRSGEGWQLVDLEGKPCSDLRFDQVEPFFDGTYAAASLDGKWGFVNTEGEWKVEPQFERAGSFGKGLAAVLVDGKWGYMDVSGRVVIEPQFEEAGPFASCGVAPVKTGEGWRYIRLIV